MIDGPLPICDVFFRRVGTSTVEEAGNSRRIESFRRLECKGSQRCESARQFGIAFGWLLDSRGFGKDRIAERDHCGIGQAAIAPATVLQPANTVADARS